MAFNNDQWQEALVSLGNTGAAPPDTSTSGTVTNNNDAVTITLPGGQSTALIQITGTFVGTLNFEASPDSGTTYYAVQASIVGGSTLATTATAPGVWRGNISGLTNFRVRLSPVTSGTASIALRLSAGVHNVFINNASTLGQTTMANSAPVVLASDEVIPTKGSSTEQAALSAGSLNADLLASLDVSGYKWLSLQLTGTWTGTLQIQASNDNSTWISQGGYQAVVGGGFATNITANNIYTSVINTRYIRIRMTAYTSGTANGTVELYTTTAAFTALAAQQIGNWTVLPGNTQNTTPWLTQGPTTTFTQAANTAGNVVGKASAGALWHATITATGTAGLDVFDNASTNAGTKLLSIPANAVVGTIYSFPAGQPAANGIVSNGVANCPAVTFGYR